MVTQAGQALYRKAVGRQTYELDSSAVLENTIFDLASVTKAIVATGFLKLLETGRCDINDSLVKYFPLLANSTVADRTVWHLLTHTSVMDIRLSEAAEVGESTEQILARIASKGSVGSEVVFANINSFLLGKIIEKISGKRLDEYMSKEVFEPLDMQCTQFNPGIDLREMIQPTEVVEGELIQGVVHDESSRIMGGITGHAGLFSCADDLTKFLTMWVNGGEYNGKQVLSKETVDRATTNQTGGGLNLQAGLGWHLNNAEYLGDHYPKDMFFHPGFVGNIIAGNRDKKITVVFLSNMIYPKRQNPQARRAFYRSLFDAVFS